MKVIAYVKEIVPVEVEVDDKWKLMEKYADENEFGSDEGDDYFSSNDDEFEEDIGKALETLGKDSYGIVAVLTMAGNVIFED